MNQQKNSRNYSPSQSSLSWQQNLLLFTGKGLIALLLLAACAWSWKQFSAFSIFANHPCIQDRSGLVSNPLIVGKTVQLKVAEGDEECQGEPTDKPWSWSSENPSVASVSTDGVVTAIAPGKFRILAKSQSKSSESLVITGTAYPSDWTVRMQPETATVKVGDRVTLGMVATDSKGNLLPSMPVMITTPDYREPTPFPKPDPTPVSNPWLDRSFHAMGSTPGTFRALRPGNIIITGEMARQKRQAKLTVQPRP
jgi:hypothetical protein